MHLSTTLMGFPPAMTPGTSHNQVLDGQLRYMHGGPVVHTRPGAYKSGRSADLQLVRL